MRAPPSYGIDLLHTDAGITVGGHCWPLTSWIDRVKLSRPCHRREPRAVYWSLSGVLCDQSTFGRAVMAAKVVQLGRRRIAKHLRHVPGPIRIVDEQAIAVGREFLVGLQQRRRGAQLWI